MSANAVAAFCENCKAPAKRLIDEKLAEKKKLNETIQSGQSEVQKLKVALDDANKKVGINNNLCEKLREENEIFQELLARAESSIDSAVKGSKDALEAAQEKLKQLEEESIESKKYPSNIKKAAALVGVVALIGSAVIETATKQRNVAESLGAFGAGALLVAGLLQGCKSCKSSQCSKRNEDGAS